MSTLTRSEHEDRSDLSSVHQLRKWLKGQENLTPRTDDEFLLLFLHSCDFDMNLSKQTILKYYENKMKIAQWWTNRSLDQPILQAIIRRKLITALKDTDENIPTIVIYHANRFGDDCDEFNNYVKYGTVAVESIARRRNQQRNGSTWIVDYRNYTRWPFQKSFSPIFLRNFIASFYTGCPMRIKKIICLNTPFVTYYLWKIMRPFLSKSINDNLHFLDKDWSFLYEVIPSRLLPEEYGGSAGPLQQHEDAFLNEVLSLEEYLKDDDNYGYHK